MNHKAKTFNLTPELNEKLDNIRNKMGFFSIAESLRYSISFTHDKMFPDYITVQKNRLAPQDRVKARLQAHDDFATDRATDLVNQQKDFCVNILKGELEPAGDGFMCKWKTYYKVNDRMITDGELSDDIMNLSQVHIDKQYQGGTKEEIQAQLKKKKKK